MIGANSPLQPFVQYESQLLDQIQQLQTQIQQISSTQQVLQETQTQLKQTQDELRSTQDELSKTQTDLSNTQTALQASEGKDNRPTWEKIADRLIEVAHFEDFQNIPYKLGAEWSNNQAYDCSSFVLRLFIYLGYSQTFNDNPGIPRGANGQSKRGIEIPFDQKRKGDLVFYNFDADPAMDHVAIYIGDDKIIQTNTPATGINVQDINTWNRNSLSIIRRWIGDNDEQLVSLNM